VHAHVKTQAVEKPMHRVH